jgi:hypothetical protein
LQQMQQCPERQAAARVREARDEGSQTLAR